MPCPHPALALALALALRYRRAVLAVALLMTVTSGALVQAQSSAPAPVAAVAQEVLARDLREEIVRIAVTVKDLHGRQETRPMPITIYRTHGGRAEFVRLAAVGDDGHAGWTIDMDSWMPLVDAFLARLGFTQPGIVARPPASGFSDLSNAEKVPVSAATRAGPYQRFLEAKAPRAFAVGDRGAWGSASGDYAHGKALGNCQRGGQNCRLYAIDDMVVWRAEP